MLGLSELVSGIANGFKTIMDEVRVPPEKKAELELQMTQLQKQSEQADRDLEAKLADVAGQNIRADAQSGDKYTSRARPTFMYIVNVILAFNYIVFPMFGKAPVNFPEALFWLFGSAILGYTGARSWEKISGQSK